MKNYKMNYKLMNSEKEYTMTVKASDIIEAKQIGAKKINRKYQNSFSFIWTTWEILD